MRSSLLLVLILLALQTGCAASNPARPTEPETPPGPTFSEGVSPAPGPATISSQMPAPIAVPTPVTRPQPSPCPRPGGWRTTDRGSRTLRIDPIGAVAVETEPPAPPGARVEPPAAEAAPPAAAGDLGAPPTGRLPTPLPR